ncbi:E3 ubiquitin-protein ligase Praja-2 [Heliangelus exortis]|uniref:E3 ubiquitin-protein ligase Praja-2 n=1 Tax=Heliangelus exortis TaxID=472823 RepID=UPI003A9151F0
MGQEAGKPVLPRPAGRFRTSTGRRYGRRHTYVVFRTSVNRQGRGGHQHNEDQKLLELECAQEQNSSSSLEIASPLVQVPSGSLHQPLSGSVATEILVHQTVANQTINSGLSPLSPFSFGLEGNKISGNITNSHEGSEDLSEYASGGCNGMNCQKGIATVDNDSYEPDSDGEKDDVQDKFSSARKVNTAKGTAENKFSGVKRSQSSADLEFQMSTLSHRIAWECCEEAGPVPSVSHFALGSDRAYPNKKRAEPSAKDPAILKSNLSGASRETQQMNTVDVGIGASVAIANELSVNDRSGQGSSPEMVVRPKIRKQRSANQLQRDMLPSIEEESDSWTTSEIAQVQQGPEGPAERALQNSKEMSSSMVLASRGHRGFQRNTEIDLGKNAAAQEHKGVLGNTTCDEFKHGSERGIRHLSVSYKDEDSSECSDGECSAAVPSYFTAVEKQQPSSEESEKMTPSSEEQEPEVGSSSSSSSSSVEDTNLAAGEVEPTSLEEGEVSSSMKQEGESSSDEENDTAGESVQSGMFLLDGNNNLEDDSSASEDLDMEWSAFDEFDGLGFPPALPFVDPRFLAFMAVADEQAVETILTHLELLGFGVEEVHPPAPKERIDSLPRIIVTDDHDGIGKDQCCTICYSEYVKDEIVTQLPCQHLFHRPCVIHWLQQSGTCPVCRRVL